MLRYHNNEQELKLKRAHKPHTAQRSKLRVCEVFGARTVHTGILEPTQTGIAIQRPELIPCSTVTQRDTTCVPAGLRIASCVDLAGSNRPSSTTFGISSS